MNNPPYFVRQRSLRRISPLFLSLVGAMFLLPRCTHGEELVGIESRVPWTGSRITGSPDPPSPYRTERVFPGIQFQNPVVLTNAPETDRLFVAELGGKIYTFSPGQNAEKPELVFDLKQAVPEMGKLYGLTFHPRYQATRTCYVCYTVGENLEERRLFESWPKEAF